MKKLNLNLENIKVMLSKEEMKTISGGEDTCKKEWMADCGWGCQHKNSSGTWVCSDCCYG